MPAKLRLSVASLALAAGHACGQASIECPPVLQVVQQGSVPAEAWATPNLRDGNRHRLLAAGLAEGRAELRHFLRPQGSAGRPNQGRFTQHFKWLEPVAEGVYLVCHYEGTTVVAQRRIEPTPRECSLQTLSSAREGVGSAAVSCR